MKAKRLIDQAGITLEELRLYNPDLRHSVRKSTVLPKGYHLHLPVGRAPRIELYEIANKTVSTKSRRPTKPLGMLKTKPREKIVASSASLGGFDPYGDQDYLAGISKVRRSKGSVKKTIRITFDE
jgi:hypothetical protein